MSNSINTIINELSNKSVENLFISKIAVVRKLQENGINNLYQLIASQNEILGYYNSKFTDLQKKSIIAVISKEVNSIYKYEKSILYPDKKDFSICFSSDILDIFISNISINSHNENGSINPFIIRYVSKSKNRYVFIKHDDFKTKICYNDTIDEQLEIGYEKYIEFIVCIHDKVYYKFVLRFTCFRSEIEGFSEISCSNSIQTKEDLNAVEYWPQNIKNKKKESLEFLYNIGVLNATDLKKCINSLYIHDDLEFQEDIDDDLLDIDGDLVDLDNEFSNIDDDLVDLDDDFADMDDDLDDDLCDLESSTENANIDISDNTNYHIDSNNIYYSGDIIYNHNNIHILYCGVLFSRINFFIINDNKERVKLSSIKIEKYGKLFAYTDNNTIQYIDKCIIARISLINISKYQLDDLGVAEMTFNISNGNFIDQIKVKIKMDLVIDNTVMRTVDKYISDNNLNIIMDTIK